MAQEDLKKAILEKIQRERDTILSQAREEADRLLQQAMEEANSLRDGYLKEIKKAFSRKKTVELHNIGLDVKSQVLDLRERRITEVISQVKEGLRKIHGDTERYRSILKHLLQESISDISGRTGLILKVNPGDKKLALEIIKELKSDIQLEVTESIDAGLVLSDSGENVIILNTFESRLEKIMPELRQEISKNLFGVV